MLFKTLGVLCASLVALASSTPLDDYVWKEDLNYKWEDLGVSIGGKNPTGTKSWTGHFLNVTSQAWLTPEDSDRHIWWHVLCVIIPSAGDGEPLQYTRNASMYVTGSGNEGITPTNLPDNKSEDILVAASLAMGSMTVTGTLFQVPNEHIVFTADPEQMRRSEDSIIAFTWEHFLNDPTKPEWLVRFPMVKSVVKAMDAMTDYVAVTHPELGCSLDYYTIAGASKRGWTTWLMGAVDPTRVMAIIPMVLDAVNFIEFAHHQYKSYDGWSFALQDYYHQNITQRFDDPNMILLQYNEDPYFYFDRLTLPKLIVNAVADEFQQPDDTHYWWSDLPEPKHFLMVPNAEHSLATGILEVVPAAGTWISHLLAKTYLPTFTWDLDKTNGVITAHLDPTAPQKVKYVRKWSSQTCTKGPAAARRDFRIATADVNCECGISSDGTCANLHVFWKHEDLSEVAPHTYSASQEAPELGWAAFFIEVTYECIGGKIECDRSRDPLRPGFIPISKSGELRFTTEVNIVPDVFPFEDCSGDSCRGVLV